MKEKIFDAFRELGFKLEQEGEMGYAFNYEGMNLVYLYNEDDEGFLNIALPGIMDIEDDKALKACILTEKINSSLKYVKAYIIGSSVWVFYERELHGDEPDLMLIISRMVLHLDNALKFARKAIADIEEAMNKDDDDDVETEEIVEDDDTNED